MEKLFNRIPLWVINAISTLSGILTIISTIFALFSIFNNWENTYKIVFLALCFFIILLIFRMRKYKKIAFETQQITSFCYHKLTHELRDLYFDIMRYHKDKSENIRNLTDTYQSQLSTILTYLCNIMEKYCGQKISSCIKLIVHSDSRIEDSTLITFCRSTTADTDRGLYENSNEPIKLCDNTDFLYIINPNKDANLNYFYQGNLKDYAKELNRQGKQYRNSNRNWENDYLGTIVVPIQIEHKRLYDSEIEDSSLHVIGFLCVDSKSTSAFLKRQERVNVDVLKSFADLIYILLSQYQHYLRKITEGKNNRDK